MSTQALHDRFNRRMLAILVAAAGIITGTAVARLGWLAAALFTAATLICAWPVQLSLGLFAATVPFDQVSALDSSGSGLALTFVIGVVAMAVLAGFGMISRRFTIPGPAVLRWSIFLAWASCSVWWAYDSEASVARISTMASLFLMYLVASCVQITEDEFKAVARLTILGGFVAALLAIYGFNGSARASLTILNRATDPNVFAASLLLPISFAVGELMSTRKLREQVLLLLTSGVILFAIFLTMSRGALLAVVVMVAIYVRKLRLSWPMALALITAYCCMFFLPSTFLSRIQDAASTGGAGRLYIWQAGLHAFSQYMVAGAGLDNFRAVYQQFAGSGERFAGISRDAHNIYLQIGVELGTVGLFLFLWAVYSQLKSFKHVYAQYSAPPVRLIACEAACWGVLTASFFLNLLWKKPLWLCLIMLALGSRLLMREAAAKSKAATVSQPAAQERGWAPR